MPPPVCCPASPLLPFFPTTQHNNHHMFGYSARHGLEWHQIDVTWMIIRTLQVLGLAHNVRLPSEQAKARVLLHNQEANQKAAAAPAKQAAQSASKKRDDVVPIKRAALGPVKRAGAAKPVALP